MFLVQIVVQEDGIVRIRPQERLCLLHIVGYIDKIAFETRVKPTMPSFVVVQKKNMDRVTLRFYLAQSELAQQ